MYRISRDGKEPIIDVDTLDQLEPAIRASKPGRFHITRSSAIRYRVVTLPDAGTVGIKRPDGSVELEPDPWEA